MAYYNELLRELNAQVVQKRRTKSKLKELSRQREELEGRVRELDVKRAAEQNDVDRLEGRSLAAFFYNVIGKKDEKLDKEREEAYAAQVKYDAAFRELSAVAEEIAERDRELDGLAGCESKYEQTLRAKAGEIKKSGSEDAEKVFAAEAEADRLEHRIKEQEEAIRAGKRALSTTQEIIGELDSAEGWGTWDLMGGGVLTDIVKHSHLDDAQALIERLQEQLRAFKTELADVEIEADIQAGIDGFMRFADYFFDGLFADWTVLDRIENSLKQANETRSKIIVITDRLKAMKGEAETELKAVKRRLDGLIEKADI